MKKIKNKYIYMLLLLVITLTGVIIVPTFAKFTENYTTEEDVVGLSFDFKIGISNIEEYEELIIKKGETLKFNVQIINNSSNMLYYGVWHKVVTPKNINNITIARLEGSETTTSGSIDKEESKIVTIIIINNGKEDLKVNIGILSNEVSTDNIEYLGGRKLVSGVASDPNETAKEDITSTMPKLEPNFITDLYNDGSEIKKINLGADITRPIVYINEKQNIMLDNNGEYRYYGKNPNNYVDIAGELFRIISVSNVKANETDTGSTRIKLIKNDSIGTYKYNDETKIGELNDWTVSTLMTGLNDSTIYPISKEVSDLSSEALYYLGGISNTEDTIVENLYLKERSFQVYDCSIDDGACPRKIIWTGKVGLLYPSDYNYASDLTICNGKSYETEDCYDNNWLYNITDDNQIAEWSLTPVSNLNNKAFAINQTIFDSSVIDTLNVRPVIYLNPNILNYSAGDGSIENPYTFNTVIK